MGFEIIRGAQYPIEWATLIVPLSVIVAKDPNSDLSTGQRNISESQPLFELSDHKLLSGFCDQGVIRKLDIDE